MHWSLSITQIPKKGNLRSEGRNLKQIQKMKSNSVLKSLKKELIVETYRSRGPGGQRKNKKETAVRLKHLPSGITVVATESRFQSQNLRLAMERLRDRLSKLHSPKKKRIPTVIPRSSVERRIKEKRIRSVQKRLRKRVILSESEE